jgi:hypothetical protein
MNLNPGNIYECEIVRDLRRSSSKKVCFYLLQSYRNKTGTFSESLGACSPESLREPGETLAHWRAGARFPTRSPDRARSPAVARFSDRPHNPIVGKTLGAARVCGAMRQWRFVTSRPGARFSALGFVRSPETDDLFAPGREHQLTSGERQ